MGVSDPSLGDFWENSPCGHLIARPDGRIVRINDTMIRWLGYQRNALEGRLFSDLFTAGGRIHYETHFEPLLHMSGELNGVTVDLVAADGARLPMFLTANVKTGPHGRPELLRISAVDAADRRSYERELLEQRRRAEAEHDRVRVFADTLRRSLLPPVLSPPDGLDAADYYHTASDDDVGGDFYDLFPLSRTRWGFFLGDVVGKGVEAAVVTGLTRYVLRSAAVSDDDPVHVLHNLHAVLGQKLGTRNESFCTVIYGNLTRRGNGFDVYLGSGGHLPPVQLRADGAAHYVDSIGGHAVGLVTEPRFVATRFHLGPGDTLMLYTDGLTEASTGVGRERFDDRGALLRFATSHAPATAPAIVDAVHALLDDLGSGVEDDVAVLAVGVPPSAGEAE
ncbi:histidine kinase [Mycobacterium colombiense]|uniref:Histidine kinase n=1 Tax=Mycobacterium colombiense TaxID=339268 RepID=A0A329KRE4_9MYCO|nr:SpoIIE family protein phosphatase [Mycobacterium colombiense]RAU96621.1 histidine kinase [Mycobacterium colombiense]